MSADAYPHLFSEWQLRNTTIENRIVVRAHLPDVGLRPVEGLFSDQAVAYYEERAKGGWG